MLKKAFFLSGCDFKVCCSWKESHMQRDDVVLSETAVWI